MSNVALDIGGRSFTVACAEGEEDHVSDLGRMIAAKIATMGDMSSQSESRMLLFAALLLADELHDATKRTAPTALRAGSAKRLERIADQLENLASRLEGEAASA
jgi:cell division protein ZapA